MEQSDVFIKVPKSIEGLEEAMHMILSEDSRVFEEAKYMLRRARVVRDYQVKRNIGRSSQEAIREICKELNESRETVTYIVRCWQYRG